LKINNTNLALNDGIIIILSYPDTVVRPAYREFSSKIWPKIGVGSKHAVQAGHAALLLIQKNTPEINYFDFGRYITTDGNGRTRSAETDPELIVAIEAKFKDDTLINTEEILLWIEKHPEKTHGSGRLIAGVNEDINYHKALKFINTLVDKKELPYGAFIKNGTNCARFVTDTIIKSTTNKKVKKNLKLSNRFTPSPIGNVIKATTSKTIYEVLNQKITYYQNRSILKEYKASFFNKFDNELNLIGTEEPNLKVFKLKKGTWLGGIGSGAWFNIEQKIDSKTYTIARYDVNGIKEFERNFSINNECFDLKSDYKFMHPSNFKEIHILQHKKHYIFTSYEN
jgi:hypothetical protein